MAAGRAEQGALRSLGLLLLLLGAGRAPPHLAATPTPTTPSRHGRSSPQPLSLDSVGLLPRLGSGAAAAVFRVSNTLSSGPGSLPQAVVSANQLAGRDTIVVDPALGTQAAVLPFSLVITDTVEVLGNGLTLRGLPGLFVQAPDVTVDSFRFVDCRAAAVNVQGIDTVLSNLTIGPCLRVSGNPSVAVIATGTGHNMVLRDSEVDGSTFGFFALDGARNATLLRCSFRDQENVAVELLTTPTGSRNSSHRIAHVTVTNPGRVALELQGNDNTVEHCRLTGNLTNVTGRVPEAQLGTALMTVFSERNEIRHVTANGAPAFGILLVGSNNHVSHTTAAGNGFAGIRLGSVSSTQVTQGNEIGPNVSCTDNGVLGLYLVAGRRTLVHDAQLNGNGGSGLQTIFAEGTVVRNSTANGNANDGAIILSRGVTVRDCVADSNRQFGIRTTSESSACAFEAIRCRNNNVGLDLRGTGHTVSGGGQFSHNRLHGIQFGFRATESRRMVVSDVEASFNNGSGLLIVSSGHTVGPGIRTDANRFHGLDARNTSSDCTFVNCSAHGNGFFGARLNGARLMLSDLALTDNVIGAEVGADASDVQIASSAVTGNLDGITIRCRNAATRIDGNHIHGNRATALVQIEPGAVRAVGNTIVGNGRSDPGLARHPVQLRIGGSFTNNTVHSNVPSQVVNLDLASQPFADVESVTLRESTGALEVAGRPVYNSSVPVDVQVYAYEGGCSGPSVHAGRIVLPQPAAAVLPPGGTSEFQVRLPAAAQHVAFLPTYGATTGSMSLCYELLRRSGPPPTTDDPAGLLVPAASAAGDDNSTVVIAAVVVALALLAAAVLAVVVRRRRQRKVGVPEFMHDSLAERATTVFSRLYGDSQLVGVDFRTFLLLTKAEAQECLVPSAAVQNAAGSRHEGWAFGTVFHTPGGGGAGGAGQVAVRSLSVGNSAAPCLLAEVWLLTALNHPHIAKARYSLGRSISLIVPRFEHTLASLLKAHRCEPRDYVVSLLYACNYLERQGILHGDIRARNVLLINGMPKLANFRLPERGYAFQLQPDAWTAPECTTDGKYTAKSEVFAAGVCMYEMVAQGATPWSLAPSGTAADRLEPDRPEACPATTWRLIRACWASNPDERPSFATLLCDLLVPPDEQRWLLLARTRPTLDVAALQGITGIATNPQRTLSSCTFQGRKALLVQLAAGVPGAGLAALATLRHHAVAPFLAASAAQGAVVLPRFKHGLLLDFLRARGKSLALNTRRRLAVELASAMDFVALETGALGAVCADNCFVDADEQLKLCYLPLGDQGPGALEGAPALLRSHAPESVAWGAFTTASDVYAWAVCCWQIMTSASEPPFSALTDEQLRAAYGGGPGATTEAAPTPTIIPSLAATGNQGVDRLLGLCTVLDPAVRPTSKAVLARAQDLLLEDLSFLEWRAELLEVALLGQGEFGVVQKCVAKSYPARGTDTVVAVKALKAGSDDLAAAARAREGFLKEMRLMARLRSNPNVVRLLGVCSSSDSARMGGATPRMVMEYHSGGSLEDFLRAGGSLSVPEQESVLHQICLGMAGLHDLGIVHRDLAARNVLLSAAMTCKISDFGLSREISTGTTSYYKMDQTSILPIRWLPPEALRTAKFSLEVDVWSFGILIFELGTRGGTPFRELDDMALIKSYVQDRLPATIFVAQPFLRSLQQATLVARAAARPSFRELVHLTRTGASLAYAERGSAVPDEVQQQEVPMQMQGGGMGPWEPGSMVLTPTAGYSQLTFAAADHDENEESVL